MENHLNDIPVGKEKAISAAALAAKWNCSERHVRTIVADLRRSGEWICSGNEGYWFPEGLEEMSATILRMTSHAIDELKAVSKMRKALKGTTNGQLWLKTVLAEVELCEE